MAKDHDKTESKPVDPRQTRLATALRRNLERRKAQVRARKSDEKNPQET